MATQVDLGPVEDVPDDHAIAVADGRAIAVRVDGEVVAFHPNCIHRATAMDGGLVLDGKLQCPMHFWRYHLPSGVHTGGRGVLTGYRVTVEDGHAILELPDPGPAMSLRERLLAHAEDWDRDAPPAPPTSRGAGGGCLEQRHSS